MGTVPVPLRPSEELTAPVSLAAPAHRGQPPKEPSTDQDLCIIN